MEMMKKKIEDLAWSLVGITLGLLIIAPLWVLLCMIVLVLGE